MRSAGESKLREINDATTDLLQRTAGADVATTEELRSEITRLAGVGFVLTRLLCLDHVEGAFALVNGDDVDGEVLGLTA